MAADAETYYKQGSDKAIEHYRETGEYNNIYEDPPYEFKMTFLRILSSFLIASLQCCLKPKTLVKGLANSLIYLPFMMPIDRSELYREVARHFGYKHGFSSICFENNDDKPGCSKVKDDHAFIKPYAISYIPARVAVFYLMLATLYIGFILLVMSNLANVRLKSIIKAKNSNQASTISTIRSLIANEPSYSKSEEKLNQKFNYLISEKELPQFFDSLHHILLMLPVKLQYRHKGKFYQHHLEFSGLYYHWQSQLNEIDKGGSSELTDLKTNISLAETIELSINLDHSLQKAIHSHLLELQSYQSAVSFFNEDNRRHARRHSLYIEP
jgi:hypothetical protein